MLCASCRIKTGIYDQEMSDEYVYATNVYW